MTRLLAGTFNQGNIPRAFAGVVVDDLPVIDLTAPDATISKGFVNSIVGAGDGKYDIDFTGTGAIADGANECHVLRYTPKDINGSPVVLADWLAGKYLFLGVIQMYSHDTASYGILHAGMRTVESGDSIDDPTVGVTVVHGLSTNERLSRITTPTSNTTTGKAGMNRAAFTTTPPWPTTVASTSRWAHGSNCAFTAADASLGDVYLNASVDQNVTDFEMWVAFGIDSTHTDNYIEQFSVRAALCRVADF